MTFDSFSEDHFKTFANQLERVIGRYESLSEEDVTVRQKRQVERLVMLEGEFRRTLIRHPEGAGVYRDFIEYISNEKGNILAARPFFRERQAVFTNQISVALKNGHEKGLYPYNFNYNFVSFVRRIRPWPAGCRLMRLAKQIEATRTELVEMNMPLAISRARIFWNKTPKSHLDYMDLVQIAAEGLMAAIDKFVLPFTTVFRSVAIGRMVGNFIEQYSETMIHFYPTDKRKIYRANKAVSKMEEGVDFQKIADLVNKDVDAAHHTTAEEIAELLSAASVVSADAQVPNSEGEGSDLLERFASLPDQQPDNLAENGEAYSAMSECILMLSVFEQKLLRLRGVDL